ncbi:exodeoxyribonuclease III [Candidatus Gracilibacteria bacterium CG17_big_fil_post_rev_8_21_14_2_50_48_13]|nr:MAG: exodeoxyribonuclease III [Candidatus Gracilibacteria bacterium CG17_big_fil_post_rev_8_21_14_2_50_48_13]
MKLISWNINGIRAAVKKGFLDFLHAEQPDLLFVQEIKAQVDQLGADLLAHEHYSAYWNSAERKGYSGTALFAKIPVDQVVMGTGIEEFDAEGRVVRADVGKYTIYGIYFPNGGRPDRLPYKYRFYDHMLEEFEARRKEGRLVIITGDFNVAHEEIDLARPKENMETSGFLPEERAWFTKLLAHGYIDTFRHFYPEEKDIYTWWNQQTRARDRNVGWRIDYFVVAKEVMPHVRSASIMADQMGSDHCPITLEVDDGV